MTSMQETIQQLIDDFNLLQTGNEKFDYLIDLGQSMLEMDTALKNECTLVRGCQSNVWISSHCEDDKLFIQADSDSLIVKGIAAMLVQILSGQPVDEILKADFKFIEEIGLWRQLSSQRGNGLTAMLAHIRFAADQCKYRQTESS